MKVVIKNEQVNVFPQFSKTRLGRGFEDELKNLSLHRNFIVPVERDGERNGQIAIVSYSEDKNFTKGIFSRLSYNGTNLSDSSRLNIEINKKGLERLDVKESGTYISSSEAKAGVSPKLIFWSPYSN